MLLVFTISFFFHGNFCVSSFGILVKLFFFRQQKFLGSVIHFENCSGEVNKKKIIERISQFENFKLCVRVRVYLCNVILSIIQFSCFQSESVWFQKCNKQKKKNEYYRRGFCNRIILDYFFGIPLNVGINDNFTRCNFSSFFRETINKCCTNFDDIIVMIVRKISQSHNVDHGAK